MTAQVLHTSREEARNLLYRTEYARFTQDQIRIFETCLNRSALTWIGFIDGEFVCVYGLCPPTLASDGAYLWLHVTPKLVGQEFTFIRQSQIVVREMLDVYPRIYGRCDKTATQSIRWLKFLGAQFVETAEEFIPFVIERADG
jgi:hypothetical protein